MTTGKHIVRYFTIIAVLICALAASAQSTQSSQALDGAWSVSLAFDQPGLPPCAPAPAIAIATSPRGGTLIADSCYASESAGYGVWSRTGSNQFAITFIGNSFGADGTVASTYKVRTTVSLGPSLNTFTGRFTTEVFDLGNDLLATFTGTVNGVRVLAER
jgi:hypothetical protein